MKKYRLVFALVVVVALGLAASGYAAWDFLRKEVLYIAIAGTFSGDYQSDGENMLKGVRLYLKQLEKEGGLPDKRIKLLIADDRADDAVAAQVAERLAQTDNVLLVIGHTFSSNSIAAGAIYRKHEIPAITATATAEDVTRGNDWYFRVVPNNALLGTFAANYIKHSLHKQTASIVAVDGPYGASLSQAFRTTASRIGLKVLNEWHLRETDTSDEDIARIVNDAAASEEPGAIFFASYGATDDVRLIVALRESGNRATIVGSESFADPKLLDDLFTKYAQAPRAAADYTNGLYAISMFMRELVGKEGFDFLHAFEADYPPQSLIWSVPCYYDAMRVAVEAIKRADLKGARYIRHNRRQVRDALAGLYAPPEYAVKGATGDIFFDANRDVNRPLAMGVYANHLLLPAFIQYQQLSNLDRIPDRIQAALTGKIMVINDQFLTRTQVVRTGIQVHQVRRIDLENTRYSVDFSLWLRFPAGLDAANLIFPNAITPIQLGPPLFEETLDQITTQVYRIQGEFTHVADFRHYPFDRQTLALTFRHVAHLLEDVIYVPDHSGMPTFLQSAAPDSRAEPLLPPHWHLQRTEMYQSVAQHTVLRNTSSFSEFHCDLRVAQGNLPLLIQLMVPLLGVSGLFILAFGLPDNRIAWRMLSGCLAFLGIVIVQFMFVPTRQSTFPLYLEYVLLSGYGLSIVGGFITIFRYRSYCVRLAIVNRIPIFQSLSNAEKTGLSRNMRRRYYRKAGQKIFQQGEPGHSLFLIVEGEVVFRFTTPENEAIEVNRFQAGRYFGELALLTGNDRTVSAITATPVRIGEIERQHILPLIGTRPELIQIMAAEMARLDILHAEQHDPDLARQLDSAALTEEFIRKITQFLQQ